MHRIKAVHPLIMIEVSMELLQNNLLTIHDDNALIVGIHLLTCKVVNCILSDLVCLDLLNACALADECL